VDYPGPAYCDTLTEYWLKVAAARGFAIDQVSFVPDHVHLIARILPKISIEECVLLLMNNGQHYMGKHYPQVFVENGINQLWEASAYAGTCGNFRTALIKSWLRREDLNHPPTTVGGIFTCRFAFVCLGRT